MKISSGLIDAVRRQRLILFVGAGVSACLDLPVWNGVLDHLAQELGYAPEIFKQYADNFVLAEYYALVKGPLGPLRSWMDREWHKNPERVKKSLVHSLITGLNFPIIYTTNFDRWLELAFEAGNADFVKIRSIADLQNIKCGVTQIVKYHGDFDDDDSIVLTESQYFQRLSFEHPLDIKFRADVQERGILFIGYSLADMNIRYLLFRLEEIWKKYGGTVRRPQSYIFLTRPNPVEEKVLDARGITPVVSDADDRQKGLLEFLQLLSGPSKSQSCRK